MKIIITIVIIITVITIILLPNPEHLTPTFGVTFSPMYTRYLGLEFKSTYLAILDDLKVKYLRIPTYWSTLETREGQFNFDDVDFMIDQASQRGAKIILVVGIKQPRWPECHIPEWARNLSIPDRQQQALEYIQKTVIRYQGRPNITAWQVENEPYVAFGQNCDPALPDKDFLQQEVNLVKSLDPQKPIMMTDSGEWSLWFESARLSDILGISVYRKTYNPRLGYITYPFPSWMYSLKAKLVGKQTIIAELQAEPWAKSGVRDTSTSEQVRLFSSQDLQKTVDYAKQTDFKEIYLWGVEWWYYMATLGHPEYLEYAKTLF